MSLQKELIEKIDQRGGIRKFITDCERLRSRLNDKSEIAVVNNMIVYYDLMYNTRINVEKDVLENPQEMEKMKDLFEKHVRDCCCGFVEFYLSIINFKAEYVQGLRPIAV